MERGGLTGPIPSEIGNLANLIFLDLDYNDLTGTLPTEIYLLTGLTQFDINNNRFSGNIDQIGIVIFLLELRSLKSHAVVARIAEALNSMRGLYPQEPRAQHFPAFTVLSVTANLFSIIFLRRHLGTVFKGQSTSQWACSVAIR
eukprot:scaffold12194_cov129-Cylindrotheca_fusiformis.AAC.11